MNKNQRYFNIILRNIMNLEKKGLKQKKIYKMN